MSYEEYGPPDGCCVDCGAETEEDHHWRCRDCYAEQQGWGSPDRDALRWQHEDRQQVTLADVFARLDRLEVTVRRLQADREASRSEAAR